MEFAENLILRMMEDPKERDKKFREHLYDLKDKCKKTKEMWSLPVRPYGFWTFERVNSQIFWDAQISQVPGRRDPYDDLLQSAYNPDISATSSSKKWSVRFCCFIHELVCCSVSMILFWLFPCVLYWTFWRFDYSPNFLFLFSAGCLLCRKIFCCHVTLCLMITIIITHELVSNCGLCKLANCSNNSIQPLNLIDSVKYCLFAFLSLKNYLCFSFNLFVSYVTFHQLSTLWSRLDIRTNTFASLPCFS